MGLKTFIEEHPLPIIVALSISVASITAGVSNYLAKQSLEIEKGTLESKYINQLSTLKNRLGSIERKIGNSEISYFDVTRLVVPRNKIKTIDPLLISANHGKFFYALPNSDKWEHHKVSELGLANMILGEEVTAKFKGLSDVLGQRNINLWRKKEAFEIDTKPKKGLKDIAPKKLSFFPRVSVQVVSRSWLSKSVASLSDTFGDKSKLDELTEKLDGLLTDITKYDDPEIVKEIAGSDEAISEVPIEKTRDVQKMEEKEEIEEVLSKLFQGDMVALMLGGIIQQQFQMTQLLQDVEIEMNTIQKKGNVLYLQISKKFNNVKLSKETELVSVIVDTEIFMVTNSKNLYLVTVELPSTDGRSDSLAWVSEWLSGLRISI